MSRHVLAKNFSFSISVSGHIWTCLESVRECERVCESVRECERVCESVRECARVRVCESVRECVGV